jgi:hypothetical protein
VVTIYDVTDGLPGENVTSTVSTGSATIAGDIITTPPIHSLTPDHRYRVEIQWNKLSDVLESWFELLAEY